jgi:hypothetical protein
MLDLNKIKSFDILSKDEQIEALTLIEKWKNIKGNEKCRHDFLEFVKAMWHRFYHGKASQNPVREVQPNSTGQIKTTNCLFAPKTL